LPHASIPFCWPFRVLFPGVVCFLLPSFVLGVWAIRSRDHMLNGFLLHVAKENEPSSGSNREVQLLDVT
jgi:hypothetical protein